MPNPNQSPVAELRALLRVLIMALSFLADLRDDGANLSRAGVSATLGREVNQLLLSTDVWVGALIRRAEAGGAFAMVLRKGDPRAGAVLVKVLSRREGAVRLYASALRGEGETVWMQPLKDAGDTDIEAYVERSRRRDPDLWVIEIEDAEGRHFLTEPVEDR
jgi:hypothetical protein